MAKQPTMAVSGMDDIQVAPNQRPGWRGEGSGWELALVHMVVVPFLIRTSESADEQRQKGQRRWQELHPAVGVFEAVKHIFTSPRHIYTPIPACRMKIPCCWRKRLQLSVHKNDGREEKGRGSAYCQLAVKMRWWIHMVSTEVLSGVCTQMCLKHVLCVCSKLRCSGWLDKWTNVI